MTNLRNTLLAPTVAISFTPKVVVGFIMLPPEEDVRITQLFRMHRVILPREAGVLALSLVTAFRF
jgi:hypothetical protein